MIGLQLGATPDGFANGTVAAKRFGCHQLRSQQRKTSTF
jgi:hypothetical protein